MGRQNKYFDVLRLFRSCQSLIRLFYQPTADAVGYSLSLFHGWANTQSGLAEVRSQRFQVRVLPGHVFDFAGIAQGARFLQP